MKSETFVERVRRYAVKHSLFEPGPVIVAVSGGADSLTLLHVLLTLRDSLDITLHIATLDHGIRGTAGALDVQAVCEIAAQWSIPVTAGSGDVPALAAHWHLGLEAAARRARYDFLAQTATALNSRQIATGHNHDDQAETVLMHVIRGSGLAGLRGMLPKAPLPNHDSMTLIRPLLETPRAEIDAYLAAVGIQPRMDTTNDDIHYTRNRLRHEVMPLLAKINPQVRAALARTAETSREDYAALRAAVPAFDMHPWGLSMERAHFAALTTSQQRILIREAVERLSPGEMLSFERTQAAIDLALAVEHFPSRISLIGDLWFGSNGISLWFGLGALLGPGFELSGLTPSFPPTCPYLEAEPVLKLSIPGTYALPPANGFQWHLHIEPIHKDFDRQNVLSLSLLVEPDALVELRTRRPGDGYEPIGMRGHSQKVKDTLINMKIPLAWRDHVPILTINERIVCFVAPTLSGPVMRSAEDIPARSDASRWQFTFLAKALEP